MTLNINFLQFHQNYVRFDQSDEASITAIQCKVALYFSYQHIKFDDKTKGIPSNFKHTFRFACVHS